MVEVQFASDLVMNLIEGLQDFSAPRLTNYYKRFEDDFPKEASVKKQLDRLFTQLLSLPAGTLRGTVFARPQVLFSLLLVLNGLHRAPSSTKLRKDSQNFPSRSSNLRGER